MTISSVVFGISSHTVDKSPTSCVEEAWSEVGLFLFFHIPKLCLLKTHSFYILNHVEDMPMTEIPRKYIVDEQNKKVAVQLDIVTFEKIEETLENYALVQLMKEGEGEEKLKVAEAKEFYKTLDKGE